MSSENAVHSGSGCPLQFLTISSIFNGTKWFRDFRFHPSRSTVFGAASNENTKTAPRFIFRLQPIFIFLLTAFLSALGSLQLGPVKSSVLQHSIKGRFRDARGLALEGALPEFL